MRKAIIFIAVTFLLVFGATPVYASDLPPLPHAFCGNVDINDSPAPVNTIVEARGEGVITGVEGNPISVTEIGKYGSPEPLGQKLIVKGDILSPAMITFYVNGVAADQTVAWQSGETTKLDLSVTIPPTIGYSPSILSFAATAGGSDPPSQTLSISNYGVNPTAMDWSVFSEVSSPVWLSYSSASGSSSGEVDSVTVSVSISGMSAGSYSNTITILAPGATNTPQTVPVTLTIWAAEAPPPAPAAPPTLPAGTTDVRGMVTTAGVFEEPVTAFSDDELCTLTIPEDTVGLTEELEPLDEITILREDDPPKPPKDADIVLAYDLGPDGATFEPAITLTFSYDPADIPEGKDVLVVAYYDEIAEAWVYLEGEVDTVTKTITVSISHFTTFAVIGRVPPEEEEVPTVVPPVEEEEEEEEPEVVITVTPTPAAFSVSNLAVEPTGVKPGETVTVSVAVANTGGESGSYTVVLKIDGVKEAEETVTIAAGDTETVSFSATREEAGSYAVNVDGLSSSFTVVLPVEPPGVNWPLIGGIIGGVIVVGLGVFFWIRRRAY